MSEEADEVDAKDAMVEDEKALEDNDDDKEKKHVMRYPKLHTAVTHQHHNPPTAATAATTPPVELQFECEEISREVGKGKEIGQWLLGRRLSCEEVGVGH